MISRSQVAVERWVFYFLGCCPRQILGRFEMIGALGYLGLSYDGVSSACTAFCFLILTGLFVTDARDFCRLGCSSLLFSTMNSSKEFDLI